MPIILFVILTQSRGILDIVVAGSTFLPNSCGFGHNLYSKGIEADYGSSMIRQFQFGFETEKLRI